VEGSRLTLNRLKAFAPDPRAQEKYFRADRWLANVAGEWSLAAQDIEREPGSRLERMDAPPGVSLEPTAYTRWRA